MFSALTLKVNKEILVRNFIFHLPPGPPFSARAKSNTSPSNCARFTLFTPFIHNSPFFIQMVAGKLGSCGIIWFSFRAAYWGGDTEFRVRAVSVNSTNFQWLKDGIPIPSATNATLGTSDGNRAASSLERDSWLRWCLSGICRSSSGR
jgi:hypothetical protein